MKQKPKNFFQIFLFLICSGIFIGVVICVAYNAFFSVDPLDNIIAVQWGDGKYGKAFYGAEVYIEKRNNGYAVLARIRIGRGNQYFHDCGQIGFVASPEEAVKKFSAIKWAPEGLTIGSGEKTYFLDRTAIESHR